MTVCVTGNKDNEIHMEGYQVRFNKPILNKIATSLRMMLNVYFSVLFSAAKSIDMYLRLIICVVGGEFLVFE